MTPRGIPIPKFGPWILGDCGVPVRTPGPLCGTEPERPGWKASERQASG